MSINAKQWEKTKEIIMERCQYAADKARLGTNVAENLISVAVANQDNEFLEYFLKEMEDVLVLDVGHVSHQCVLRGWVDTLEILHKSKHVDLFLSADDEYVRPHLGNITDEMKKYLGWNNEKMDNSE